MTSRMMPNSSKYPPRPMVPNGSLKVIVTDEILLRFQRGWKMELANLKEKESKFVSGKTSKWFVIYSTNSF